MWHPYQAYGHHSSPVYLPVVEFEILPPLRPGFLTAALVDSGADTALLHIEIADHLKLPVRSVPPITSRGVAGPFDAYPYPITARMDGVKFKLLARWADLRDPKTGQITTPNLLGRGDFLRAFKVTFDERKRGMEIVPYAKPKKRGH